LVGPNAAKPFNNYKVYIQAYDSAQWGGDDIQYFADVSMYDGCEYPYFKQVPSDIDINLGFFDDFVASTLPLASFNTQ